MRRLGTLERVVRGAARRCFRRRVLSEMRKGNTTRTAGRSELRGYGYDMQYPDRLVWIHQVYEIVCCDVYGARRLPADPFIVDIGANVGTFSLYARWVRPGARITAVEPMNENLDYLRRNLARCEGSTVNIVAAAAGAAEGVANVAGPTSDSAGIDVGEGQETPVIPASQLLDRHVDLLKIDVEGAEVDVLKGASDALRCVDRIVLEYHQYRQRPNELPGIMQLLAEREFDRFRIFDYARRQDEAVRTLAYTCMLEAWRS